MRLVYITAGSGRMECDACLRDAWLAREFRAQGHELVFLPTYTPPLEEAAREAAAHPIFYGGINVFLRARFPAWGSAPLFLRKLLDHPSVLRLTSKLGDMTAPQSLAGLTISVLEGENGPHRAEVERVLEYLAAFPKPDMVLLPNSMFAGLAMPLRRGLGVPVACLLSGEDPFLEQFPAEALARVKKVLREQAARVDVFIAPSRYYADFMREYLDVPPDKFHVVPMGIDLRGFETLQRPERGETHPFTIGYRSPVCPANGLHLLAEAFHILKQRPETANCRLHCAGYVAGPDREYFAKIQETLRRRGHIADFAYAGELSPAERLPFLAEVDVLSVPTTYPEPIGPFVPEALAAGVPVVVPNHGCLPEWIAATGGGILVPPNDPSALAEALGGLMQSRALAARMGRAGRESVFEKFSPFQAVHELLRVFVRATGATP